MAYTDRVRASCVLWAFAVLLACGPGPTGEGSAEATATSSAGDPTTSTGPSVSTVSTVSTSGSTAGTGHADGTTTTSSSSSEGDADAGIKLDVFIPDLAEPTAGPYESCFGATCGPGLECQVLAQGKDLLYTSCTAPCEDPRADCPGAPWPSIVCHPLMPEQGVCALACDQGLCPPGMECLDWLGAPVPICSELF